MHSVIQKRNKGTRFLEEIYRATKAEKLRKIVSIYMYLFSTVVSFSVKS